MFPFVRILDLDMKLPPRFQRAAMPAFPVDRRASDIALCIGHTPRIAARQTVVERSKKTVRAFGKHLRYVADSR